jgi:hypothetical protein
MMLRMIERRTKRSAEREEALQYLIEAVADRSDVHAIALVSDEGRILAGTGVPRDLAGLARIAGPVARREKCEELERATEGTDVMVRAFAVGATTLYLAALGERVMRMGDALRAVERIASAARRE